MKRFTIVLTVLGLASFAGAIHNAAWAAHPIERDSFTIGNQIPTGRSIVSLRYHRETGPDMGMWVCQSYLLIEPPAPAATLVLFVGGNGRVGVADGGVGITSTNFLFRNRDHFAGAGPFNVVVIDAPFVSVAEPPLPCPQTGLLPLFGQRTSDGHMDDVETVISDIRGEALGEPSEPVFLVGTSRGTISAGNAAAVLVNGPPAGPDGLVLTSSLTNDPRPERNDLDDVPLENVTVPALVISHAEDGCSVTPPEDIDDLEDRLKVGALVVKADTFDGGFTPMSDPCNALSEHGFFGIELEVVEFIAEWILDLLPLP